MALTTVIVIAAILSTVASQGPFDPEEMLFIFTRCMEDHLPDGSSRGSTLLKWKNWDLQSNDDANTQCYVKCVLDKTGLYNPSAGKFNSDVIKTQSSSTGIKADDFADAVEKLSNVQNECSSVFNAYVNVHNAHKETSRKLFHGDSSLTEPIYKKGEIRQKRQSYLEFCENKFYPKDASDRKDLCDIRNYKVKQTDAFKNLIECDMKGFRYITKDNQLNRDEIERDFKLVNKGTEQLNQVLNECNGQGDSVAVNYYSCLVQSSILDDFKEAFDYREVRSRDYGYNLAQKKPYNRDAVKAEIDKIDSDLSC